MVINEGIDCAHSRSLKMLPCHWFRKIRVCIEAKIQHVLISLNQGSVFKLRECAQSIPRMKLPPEIWFWGRNFKIFRFSFQYTHLFPESGSKKHFHASGMRAIDFSHDFTSTRVIFVKINFFRDPAIKCRIFDQKLKFFSKFEFFPQKSL